MSRRADSPWRYDRGEMRSVLQGEGMEAALKRWPRSAKLLRQIARAVGVLPAYAPGLATWKPEWTELLGTKPDWQLAADLGISHSTVNNMRRLLRLPRKDYREVRGEHHHETLASVNDDRLRDTPLAVLKAETGVPLLYIVRERERRGLVAKPGGPPRPVDTAALRRAAIAGMLMAHPGAKLAEVGRALGITGERARQLLLEVQPVLAELAATGDAP